jgi:hypothetical protein
MVTHMHSQIHGPELDSLINETTPHDRLAWLAEKHEIAERREARLETFEAAILIFVFLEVLREYILAPVFHVFR